MNARIASYLVWSIFMCAGLGCAAPGSAKWVWDAESTTPTGPSEELRTKLATRISVAFDRAKLGQVIDDLRQVYDVNLIANWPVLETVGIEKDTALVLEMNQVPLEQVLTAMVSYIGAGETEVWWEADGDVINISTAEHVSLRTVSRIYDVSELIRMDWDVRISPELFVHHGFCEVPNCPHHSRQPQVGCFGPGIVPTCEACGYPQSCRVSRTLTGTDAIIGLIVHRIHYDSWRIHGGNVGVAHGYGPFLVIEQTRKAHGRIEAFLQMMRAALRLH